MLPARDESSWPIKKKQERLEAIVKAHGGYTLRLVVNRQTNPDGLHVHLDAARNADRFEVSPEINATVEHIADRIDQLSNNEIGILGQVDFEFPKTELPPQSAISLLLGIRVGPKGSDVRLSGSSYRAAEGPIQCIEWTLKDRDRLESIEVKVLSRFTFQMRDQVYSQLVAQSTNAFERFILEKFEPESVEATR